MADQLTLFELPETEGSTTTFKPARHPVWTEHKARLIAEYLRYFVFITKHGAYIDGFAGPQQPDKPDMWAARLVLETEPRWLRSFFLCDSDQAKAAVLSRLRDEQPADPNREIEVHCGDFNRLIHDILGSSRLGERVATFCLLDQRTFECEWETVRLIALHKAVRKVEQFYFLPSGWLDRAIVGLRDTSVVEKWWGRPDWDVLRGGKVHERADLFCQRFREELGYSMAHAWPIYDRQGGRRVMYHMVHATDHPEGPNLMARAYRRATGTQEPLEQLELELEAWRKSRD